MKPGTWLIPASFLLAAAAGVPAQQPARPAAGEPTNAAESVAKKAAADAALNADYQKWKATLPPEHQA